MSVSEHAQQKCQSMCAVVSCPQDTQKSRLGSQRLTTGLQVSPSWQDDLCGQCLVGLHHGC